MKIILQPVASDKTTKIKIDGLIITIDEIEYDLSEIPEGGVAEAEPKTPFIGILTRDEITIKYEYDRFKAERFQSPNIEDYSFDVFSGEVPSPIKWREE